MTGTFELHYADGTKEVYGLTAVFEAWKKMNEQQKKQAGPTPFPPQKTVPACDQPRLF